MIKLLCVLPIVAGLVGCNPVDKIREIKNKVPKAGGVGIVNRETRVRVPAKETVTLKGEWENPFIVLFTEKTGRVAGYYRVAGKIHYVGPRWADREFILKCSDDFCVLKDEKLKEYRPSHIRFTTVDGCFFTWGSTNFLLSKSEVILNEKPVLGKCKPLRRK